MPGLNQTEQAFLDQLVRNGAAAQALSSSMERMVAQLAALSRALDKLEGTCAFRGGQILYDSAFQYTLPGVDMSLPGQTTMTGAQIYVISLEGASEIEITAQYWLYNGLSLNNSPGTFSGYQLSSNSIRDRFQTLRGFSLIPIVAQTTPEADDPFYAFFSWHGRIPCKGAKFLHVYIGLSDADGTNFDIISGFEVSENGSTTQSNIPSPATYTLIK